MYGVIEEFILIKKDICYYFEIYRKYMKEIKIYLFGSVVYVLYMVINE